MGSSTWRSTAPSLAGDRARVDIFSNRIEMISSAASPAWSMPPKPWTRPDARGNPGIACVCADQRA